MASLSSELAGQVAAASCWNDLSISVASGTHVEKLPLPRKKGL